MHILFCQFYYRCETRCHVDRIKWKVLDKRVLRNVFGTDREEEAVGRRELHSGRIYDLHSSPNTIRVIRSGSVRWAKHVAHVAAKRKACRVLVENLAGKRAIGRPSCRWEYNIKIYLQ